MTHSSYKNGALKEAHCTMNKQIGVKNTENANPLPREETGRGVQDGKGGATNTGVRQN